ncbi:MAG: FAD:protein FMN transferase [Clostridiales Family XIII bacterium]|jgi:thiamine biosynthesis lipoprotein|nr:FAD:protein FMN transferase [Clostridiales Family XIII bacterium]
MRHKPPAAIAGALLAAVLTLSACAQPSAGASSPPEPRASSVDVTPAPADSAVPASYDDIGFVMGTVVNQTIYAGDKTIAQDITNILQDTEEKWMSWRAEDSDIAAVNAAAGTGTKTPVSAQTAAFLTEATRLAADSGGAFDPTIGKLTRLWDFDGGKNEVPPAGDIAALAQDVGYEGIYIEGNDVALARPTGIDLGAMGKGIGCDEIQAALEGRTDVRGALVNIGGSSVLTYGQKDSAEPWKVAVTDPRDTAGFLGVLALEGTNHVSTSGDYERYFEADGKRYHHVLDPHTGYPANSGLMSVTVVAARGAASDALSTACFVLGYGDAALALLASYGADAVFVTTDRQIHVTDGLRDRFTQIADGYTLQPPEQE